MKQVSIIVPIYNVEEYLPKCLETLIQQTLKEIEIILINDGSKDKSLEICLEYAKKDKRIRVIDKVNEGVSVARNVGIELAEGEYIGFVDPDDWIEPEMYEALYNKITQIKYPICVCNYYKDTQASSTPKLFKFKNQDINKDNKLSRTQVIEYIIPPMIGMDDILPRSNSYIMGCVWRGLYQKEFLDEYNIRFAPGISIMEDLVFNVQALLASDGISIEEGVWYHYVQHTSSVLHSYNKNMWIDQIRVHELLETALEKAGLKEEMQNRLDMRYIGMAFSAIYNEMNRGNENNIKDRLSEIREICKDEKLRVSLERAKPIQTSKNINRLNKRIKRNKKVNPKECEVKTKNSRKLNKYIKTRIEGK